jgi:shikimate dehydrogenase
MSKRAEFDYVVVGNPVAHSMSPQIHSRFAQLTGEHLRYGRLKLEESDFVRGMDDFFAAGGLGANVTVPFKVAAAAWVDELDQAATFAGAVNTIVTRQDGSYLGCNTDGIGLLADLHRQLKGSLEGSRILVLGAGGAVRGILGPLADEAPAEITIANRTVGRARSLAADLGAERPGQDVRAVALADTGGGYDLVINGTSAGLSGALAPIPADAVADAFCYDMVYGAQTAFCDWSLRHRARAAVDGLGMLVEQAAAAFELWRGVRPDAGVVLAELLSARQD